MPSEPVRNLSPLPEPSVNAAIVHELYLPVIVNVHAAVIGADATIYGYASPHRRTYEHSVFYNWAAYARDCVNPNFWPMVRGQAIQATMIDACDDGRTLLVYNEPELGSFSATPTQAAIFVRYWSKTWSGPVACCGNFYSDGGGDLTGVQWFIDFVKAYLSMYGELPQLSAIHLHVYEHRTLDMGDLKAWRIMADIWGWSIIVSESGTFPSDTYTPDEIAARLPGFLAEVEDTLQPDHLIWFSDYVKPWALGGPPQAAWHNLNLTNADNTLTPVGEAWQRYTGETIEHQPTSRAVAR